MYNMNVKKLLYIFLVIFDATLACLRRADTDVSVFTRPSTDHVTAPSHTTRGDHPQSYTHQGTTTLPTVSPTATATNHSNDVTTVSYSGTQTLHTSNTTTTPDDGISITGPTGTSAVLQSTDRTLTVQPTTVDPLRVYNTTVGTTATQKTTEGIPPAQQTTEGLPSAQNTTEGIPPAQKSTKGIPPARKTTEGIPPAQETTDGIPPAQQTTDGIPPAQQTTEGIPPVQQTTERIPPAQQTTQGITLVQQTTEGILIVQQTTDGTTADQHTTTLYPSRSYPITVGNNVELGFRHPSGTYRAGQATDTTSCDHVRGVPEELRRADVMYQYGIHESYTKYTEAYGIPIYGSANVTADGLRRTCYVLRLMLASRYDVRNSLYKLYVRVALIGDGEQQTDLWDYRLLDSDYWDARARGVGATLTLPVCSAGDDNMRCRPDSRYSDQDILVHEFAHGVHQLGAALVIPRFQARLEAAYRSAMQAGMYANTYMATNVNEYFAQASQIYFESFHSGTYTYDIDGARVTLNSRASLQLYDPELVALLDEAYSCPNTLVNRCAFKDACNSSMYVELRAQAELYTLNCPTDYTYYRGYPTPQACALQACRSNATAFRHSGNLCQTLRCESASLEYLEGRLEHTGVYGFNIWRQITPLHINHAQEMWQELMTQCTSPPDVAGRCAMSERVQCGPEQQSREQCVRRGCCFLDGQCVYSKLAGCVDQHRRCSDYAVSGECARNPGLMHRQCPLSCDLCTNPSPYSQEDLQTMCQDKNFDCSALMTDEQCQIASNQNCALSCGLCSV